MVAGTPTPSTATRDHIPSGPPMSVDLTHDQPGTAHSSAVASRIESRERRVAGRGFTRPQWRPPAPCRSPGNDLGAPYEDFRTNPGGNRGLEANPVRLGRPFY